jgi:hypothetical protein
MTALFTFLKSLPSWFYGALIGIGLVYGAYCIGKSYQTKVDQVKYDHMVANADTSWKAWIVNLPKPNPSKPIKGTVVRDTTILIVAVSDSEKVKPYEVTYSDKVDSIVATAYPEDTTISFMIIRKPQNIQIPQITLTLPPVKIPWYATGTAKSVEAIIGTTLIYSATQSTGTNRMYKAMAGVGFLTVSFSL